MRVKSAEGPPNAHFLHRCALQIRAQAGRGTWRVFSGEEDSQRDFAALNIGSASLPDHGNLRAGFSSPARTLRPSRRLDTPSEPVCWAGLLQRESLPAITVHFPSESSPVTPLEQE